MNLKILRSISKLTVIWVDLTIFLYYFTDAIKDAMKQKFANDIKARVIGNDMSFTSHEAFFTRGGIF